MQNEKMDLSFHVLNHQHGSLENVDDIGADASLEFFRKFFARREASKLALCDDVQQLLAATDLFK